MHLGYAAAAAHAQEDVVIRRPRPEMPGGPGLRGMHGEVRFLINTRKNSALEQSASHCGICATCHLEVDLHNSTPSALPAEAGLHVESPAPFEGGWGFHAGTMGVWAAAHDSVT